MENAEIVEYSYDIHTAANGVDIPNFKKIKLFGMAASLAIHIKGLSDINYSVLEQASEYYFQINQWALPHVLELLEELSFIQINGPRNNIKSITPTVPRFYTIYEGIGSTINKGDLREDEEATISILNHIQEKPDQTENLKNKLSIDNTLFERCLNFGIQGSYFVNREARGKRILLSPLYFADNYENLAEVAVRTNSDDIAMVLNLIKNNQGWPISLLKSKLQIGTHKLTTNQFSLIDLLCSEGILKPPSLNFNTQSENFVFTPRPGSSRLNSENREIYERAMALVSCVRKGQLLPGKYAIKYPVAILNSLKNKGFIGASSEARYQYSHLTKLLVGRIVSTNSFHKFELIKTYENIQAIDLAISLLDTGEVKNMEVDQDARIALSRDENYISSIIASSALRKQKVITPPTEITEQFDQLFLEY